jgi:NAD(P)-dependent dehydrogenase (short-subunit alcohol dehydrogenase family)
MADMEIVLQIIVEIVLLKRIGCYRVAIESSAMQSDYSSIMSNLVAPIEYTEPADFLKVLNTNTMGLVRVVKETIPLLRKNGNGRILSMYSPSGHVPIPLWASYNCSKSAMGMFLDVSKELWLSSHYNIDLAPRIEGI